MKKFEDEEHENSERWLLTYSDLITLLMIFFVIMYAMSNINAQKYESLSQSLNSAMGGGGGNGSGSGQGSITGFYENVTADNGITDSDTESVTDEYSLSDVEEELKDYLTQSGLDDYAVVVLDERGLAIRLKDSVVFDSGESNIKDSLISTITKIGKIINKIDGYVRVEGHTDNIPINNYKYKSNWQLSAVRAANVAELLLEESGISPDRLSAIGYGEYRPIADNSTAEGRAKNRRVEIILISNKPVNIDTIN